VVFTDMADNEGKGVQASVLTVVQTLILWEAWNMAVAKDSVL
jgi:hypothetical protein